MIAWGRQAGDRIYRLGPFFPEVPREWPIARVSAFKTKFGGRSIPLVYASLYRRPEKYLARLPARASESRPRDASSLNPIPRRAPSRFQATLRKPPKQPRQRLQRPTSNLDVPSRSCHSPTRSPHDCAAHGDGCDRRGRATMTDSAMRSR